VAVQVAHEMGLMSMTPQDMARFEKEYWDKRLQADHDLIEQFRPIYQAGRQKINEELYREFSSIAVQAAPKPQAAASKPAAVAPPTTTAKHAPGAPTTDVAQAPR
jgi:hypothetical protein